MRRTTPSSPRRWPLDLVARALPVVAFAAALAPAPARAQTRGYPADRLILAPNPDDTFATFRPYIAERTRFFGSLTADYVRRPLKTVFVTDKGTVQAAFPDGVVSNQANLFGTVGVELLSRLSISFTMPVTVVNTTADQGGRFGGAVTNGVNLANGAAGDLRFDARALLFKSAGGGFRTAAAATQFFATGDAVSFAGEGRRHTLLQLTFEQQAGALVLHQFAGVHLRAAHDIGTLHFQNELVFGAGAFVPLRDGRVRVGGEIFGQTAIDQTNEAQSLKLPSPFFKGKYTPVEWLGEVRVAFGEQRQGWFSGGLGSLVVPGYSAPDVRVVAQVGYTFSIEDTHPPSPPRRYEGLPEVVPEKTIDTDKDGLPDAIDACPTVPEDKLPPDPSDGCPGIKDRDGDGIVDDKDQCPDEPEDIDGFRDQDGCVDPDDDGDGILDVKDACRREPGPASPDPQLNGCPQFIKRIEGSNEIQILKKIEFDTAKATIKPGSFPILDEVVKLLKANPNIKKVSIEGHTDDRGSAALNKKLSQDRAESCLKYLVEKGISADRLTATGFGPEKPIDDNKTNDGRQRNRRTEFHIVEQD